MAKVFTVSCSTSVCWWQSNLTNDHMGSTLVMAMHGIYQFYCVNTSYPMDNCFTGRHDRSHQTSEKDVLYIIPAGPVTECAFARCRHDPPFLFTYCDVKASFSFGAKECADDFHQRYVLCFFTTNSSKFRVFY